MINPMVKKTSLKQLQVMGVIAATLIIGVFGCSQDDKTKLDYELPKTYTHLPLGKAIGISPLSFVDTLNNGAMGEVYYILPMGMEDPGQIVNVPGLKIIGLGELNMTLDTLKSREPLFLISRYGADARNVAQNSTANGFTCFYVVGGSYKLNEVMRQQRLKIFPRPHMNK